MQGCRERVSAPSPGVQTSNNLKVIREAESGGLRDRVFIMALSPPAPEGEPSALPPKQKLVVHWPLLSAPAGHNRYCGTNAPA